MAFSFQCKFTDDIDNFLKFVRTGLNAIRKVDFSMGKEPAAN